MVITLVLIYFGRSLPGYTIKTNLLLFRIQKYPQFQFFMKCSGTSFPTAFCSWLFKKKFWCFILISDKSSLSGWLYFLRYRTHNICIVIICCLFCNVINFEIKYQKIKYLKNEKSIQHEIKSILKGFYWRKYLKTNFWEAESPTLK